MLKILFFSMTEQLKFDPLPPETICIEKGKRTEIKCGARGAKDPAVRWTTGYKMNNLQSS